MTWVSLDRYQPIGATSQAYAVHLRHEMALVSIEWFAKEGVIVAVVVAQDSRRLCVEDPAIPVNPLSLTHQDMGD